MEGMWIRKIIQRKIKKKEEAIKEKEISLHKTC